MNLKKIFILFIGLISGLFAQNNEMTFEETVQIALKNNLTVNIAKNTAEISKNNAHPGKSGLLPTINMNGNVNYQYSEAAMQNNKSTYNSAKIQGNYTLFRGFGNVYSYLLSKSNMVSGKLQTRYQIEMIIANVAKAYYNTKMLEDRLEISKKSLEISAERLKRMQEKENFGQAKSVDVLNAKVDFNNDSISVADAQQNLDQARRQLNTLLNREASHPVFLAEVNADFQSQFPVDTLITQALANNASYLLAVQGVEQADLNYKIAKAANYPSLNLTGSYGYSEMGSEFDPGFDDPVEDWSVGLSLNFSLFDGFRKSINRQNAKIQKKNEKLAQKNEKLNLLQNVKNINQSYKYNLMKWKFEKDNLQSAQINFKRTSEFYEMGQATSTQFREAQLNLIRAKNNISLAFYNAKIQEIELLKMTGKLLK